MATFAQRTRRHFLWLLLAAYGLSVVLPAPGEALAAWQPLGEVAAGGARFPMALVAVLLLLAAVATDFPKLRVLTQRPWLMAVSLAGVWLGPALAVGAATFVLPTLTGAGSSGLLLGLALVAAMPVANSSVGWTQQSGGNQAWGIGLVVTSIMLCPWVTPGLLRLAGLALSSDEAARVDTLVTELTGLSFILWVLLPTALGFALRPLLSAERIDRWAEPMRLTTTFVLLLLNYVNGSAVASQFKQSPPEMTVIVASALAALALSLIGVVIAWALADGLRLDQSTRSALTFGLSMKNTGLALGLAASVLREEPIAGLLIAVATPMQHLVASVLDRWLGANKQDPRNDTANNGNTNNDNTEPRPSGSE